MLTTLECMQSLGIIIPLQTLFVGGGGFGGGGGGGVMFSRCPSVRPSVTLWFVGTLSLKPMNGIRPN